jgi:flagellar assembly factor FliW
VRGKEETREMGELESFHSQKLGWIRFRPDQVIEFVEGLLGFPELRRYVLIDHRKGVFMWLQSLEDPSIAFLVVDPWVFFPHYSPEVPDEDVEALGLEEPYNFSLFCLVTVPADPRKMTVNLKGPVVVNLNNRRAKQVVVSNPEYPIRQPVFPEGGEEGQGEGEPEG